VRRAPETRFWRRPFDADSAPRTQGIVKVHEERCKGCAYCVEYCPRGVLIRSERFNLKGYHPPDVMVSLECAACGLCELICPEFAIRVGETESVGVENER
jgi:2-oxoglutarate ferredoxin oxidoreductase subunit delta